MQEEIQIQVKDLDDTIIQISGYPNERLIDILIRAEISVDDDYLSLAASVNGFTHTLHEKGDSPLSDLDITPSSEISIFRLQPCGNAPLSIFAFNKMEQEKRITFGPAPRWRAVKQGVSFRGKCNNSNYKNNIPCDAYKKVAYITLGFGIFDVREVMEEKALCPICRKAMIEVDNFGFFLAQWKISGRQKGGIKFKMCNKSTEKNIFSTFEEGDNVMWQYMGLEVRTLNDKPFN